jgi:hypothetical protein
MLNNPPKAKADVKLFIIKLVADERKSGKDSTTVDLSREKIVSFNVTDRKVRGQSLNISQVIDNI